MKRRIFTKNMYLTGMALAGSQFIFCKPGKEESKILHVKPPLFFKLSLAQWSFNRAIKKSELSHLDFAEKAKSLGFEGIEYVNQFFGDKAEDFTYLDQMNKRAIDNEVSQLLIMVDDEGHLATKDKAERDKAVENHYKWVNAAKYLGCHSIRVNAHGKGTKEEVSGWAVDGLSRLAEYAAKEDINVLVENHGGYSSDGQWLSGVMKQVNLPNCGTLPDFGNFCVTEGYGSINEGGCIDAYDIYKGVDELMPFAKAISAKTYDFDNEGNQPKIDFKKMLEIINSYGYTGFIGVEYEGNNLSEEEGVKASKALLEKAARSLE